MEGLRVERVDVVQELAALLSALFGLDRRESQAIASRLYVPELETAA